MRRIFLPAILLAVFLVPHGAHAQPSPPSPPSVLTIPWGWPKSLAIPRIRVTAPVDADPLSAAKPIDQQPPWFSALWYSRGVKPGLPGHALIYGHLDTYSGPAAFWNLHELHPGDRLTVGYNRGSLRFQVVWVHEYADTAMPYRWIYGPDRQRGIVLVTCSGTFHGLDSGGYDHRLVVYARLLLPNGTLD